MSAAMCRGQLGFVPTPIATVGTCESVVEATLGRGRVGNRVVFIESRSIHHYGLRAGDPQPFLDDRLLTTGPN